MAKLLGADASWAAAEACLQTHGGFGFAEEYDVERKYRETRLYQVAPISTNLILSVHCRTRAGPAAELLMSVALKNPMSLEDFLDWESRQEFKYEFDGSQPVAMTGVTSRALSHPGATCWGFCSTACAANAVSAHGSNLKIQVAGRIRIRRFIVARRGGCSRSWSNPAGTDGLHREEPDRPLDQRMSS